MLVEVLVSCLIISSSLLASSQLLSNLRLRSAADLEEKAAVQLAQDELERVLASKAEGHGWFWASVCTHDSPCHTEHKPNGWWLSQGSIVVGDFTVGTWLEHGVGERKTVRAKITWEVQEGGEIIREMLVTNPQLR